MDFTRETGTTFEAIALKSGPNIFNSDQSKKQNDQFDGMRRSLSATLRGKRKQFIPMLGCCYGQCAVEPSAKRRYGKLAGQAFWEHFIRDENFYLKLVDLMGQPPSEYAVRYRAAWNRAVNRFTKEFAKEFCRKGTQINWRKLIEFKSGRPKAKRMR